ncbi:hypothetical protein [Coleofasciculus sp. FACHB-129]|uniref:hypothetical protein n=1 Tax=Cyanophyceae TaxID=3028117 RepID=UPI0016823474|nr:hypothetical protein [Coleofasciculus sp. FACHB-129]MBD1893261.1 hypothetical protein [Coleofasciculus sp. FACHB-129]
MRRFEFFAGEDSFGGGNSGDRWVSSEDAIASSTLVNLEISLVEPLFSTEHPEFFRRLHCSCDRYLKIFASAHLNPSG